MANTSYHICIVLLYYFNLLNYDDNDDDEKISIHNCIVCLRLVNKPL